eukprot:1141638-Pelagomonas_calceolata.AAC.1
MIYRYTDEGLLIPEGSPFEDHTDAIIHSAETEIVRYANLPKAIKGMQAWTAKQRNDHVERTHNVCLVTFTNRPWYLMVAYRGIARGEVIEAHYGPSSGLLLGQYAVENFVY